MSEHAVSNGEDSFTTWQWLLLAHQTGLRAALPAGHWKVVESIAFFLPHAYPGKKKIAEAAGMSQPSVKRCVADLEAWGVVEVRRRLDPNNGDQITNVYTFADLDDDNHAAAVVDRVMRCPDPRGRLERRNPRVTGNPPGGHARPPRGIPGTPRGGFGGLKRGGPRYPPPGVAGDPQTIQVNPQENNPP